jgi:phosphatidylglycerophosphate synthase
MDGRKIPSYIENPIDDILIRFSIKLNPFLHQLGFTPNILTTFSFLFGVAAAYSLWLNHYFLTALFILISYIFDTLDGNMARMFNMVTSFGDYYDHVTDIIQYTLLYTSLVLNKRIPLRFKVLFISASFILLYGVYTHFGCQEKSYNKPAADSLTILEGLCANKDYIHTTKYFGMGTWIIIVCILILSLKYII